MSLGLARRREPYPLGNPACGIPVVPGMLSNSSGSAPIIRIPVILRIPDMPPPDAQTLPNAQRFQTSYASAGWCSVLGWGDKPGDKARGRAQNVSRTMNAQLIVSVQQIAQLPLSAQSACIFFNLRLNSFFAMPRAAGYGSIDSPSQAQRAPKESPALRVTRRAVPTDERVGRGNLPPSDIGR